jgi:protocatechuate 3,4-dioxygenase, alpha subunit
MTMDYVPTPSQTVGPFLHIGMTQNHSVPCIAAPTAKEERLKLKCRVLDGDGVPLNDAMIEIWQADSEGRYNHPDDPRHPFVEKDFFGFGRMATDENGTCEFETIKPGRVPGAGAALQAPHLNVAVYARGILLQLYTRIYFAGDPANAEDPVLSLVPSERRGTLMAHSDPAGGWVFDVHLRGVRETVFFNV